MREIDKVLDKNEKVFWEGAPQGKPYVLSNSIILSFFLAFIVVPLLLILPLVIFPDLLDETQGQLFFIILIFALDWCLGILFAYLSLKNTYFAITNKRVIIQKGIIGRDFQYIDFDQIKNAEVNVGLWDKLFGKNSGSILISSAGYHNLSNIDDPYKAFKLFKDIGHSVKTDIQFPNKYRPSENSGYNSKYKPK